jgi:hypothetical protein
LAAKPPPIRILSRRRGTAPAAVVGKFPTLVTDLKRRRFKPVITPAVALQAAALGLAAEGLADRPPDTYQRDYVAGAEVFIKGDAIVLCLVRRGLEVRQVRRGASKVRRGAYEYSPSNEVTVHLYAHAPEPNPAELEVVASSVHSVMGVETRPVWGSNRRFDELLEEGMREADSPASDDLAAARALADANSRALAIALRTSGGLLVADVPKQLPNAAAADMASDALQDVDLAATETVVICKRTGREVARVPSNRALTELGRRGLRCACGAPITDERTEEALAATNRGRELLDGSRWMSLLLLEELTNLGVRPSQIAIEQTVGGDELDCVAVLGGRLVLFELKDKEFNLGNAYSFGAKMSLVRPQLPVIITTEYVGGDAKEHFARIQAPPSAQVRAQIELGLLTETEAEPAQGQIRYIEGLDNLRDGLAQLLTEIDNTNFTSFLQQVLPLASLQSQDVVERIAQPTPSEPRATPDARRSGSGKKHGRT